MWPVHVHLTQALHQALKGEKGDTGEPGSPGEPGEPGLNGTGSRVWGHLSAPLLSQSNDVYLMPAWFGGDTWKIVSGDIDRTLTEGENGGGGIITLVNFWPMQWSAGNLSGEFDTELVFFPIKLQGYLDGDLIYETAITVGHIPAAGQVQVVGITIPPSAPSATLTVTPPIQSASYGQWVNVTLDYTIVGDNPAWWYIERQVEGDEADFYTRPDYLDEDYYVTTSFNFNPTGSGSTSMGIRLNGDYVHYRFKLLIYDPGNTTIIASSPIVTTRIDIAPEVPSTPYATLTTNGLPQELNGDFFIANTVPGQFYPITLAYTYNGDAYWSIFKQNFSQDGTLLQDENALWNAMDAMELPEDYFSGPFLQPDGNGMQTLNIRRYPDRSKTRYVFSLFISDPSDDNNPPVAASPPVTVIVR